MSKGNLNSKNAKQWNGLKEKIFETIFCAVFLSLFILLLASTKYSWHEFWQISFMISLLICSSIAVAYPLFKKAKITIPELIIVGHCVLLLLISVIIFTSVFTGIYRDPIIQISASFTGGLMTLYGVGLTVKYSRLAKEQEDIKKAKPNIFPIGQQTWKSLIGIMKLERDIELQIDLSNLKIVNKGTNLYSFAPIHLANSDLSMCTFKGIIINEKNYLVFMYDVVLLKGSANCFKLDCYFEYKETIESIQLVLGDMLGNNYSCFVSFDASIKKNNKTTQIHINGVFEIMPADKHLPDVFKD